MSWRCWIGWHKWLFRETLTPGTVLTHCCCERTGCKRYPSWTVVNVDPRKPW